MSFSFSKILNNKSGLRLNRRVITFLFCVVISAFFWLMLSLAKDYTVEFRFPVSYTNLPTDKVIINTLPSSIDIEINASGFNILLYKLKHKKEVLSIDLRDIKPYSSRNRYYITTNSRIAKITNQLDNNIQVLKISPDTIHLNFNKKVSKKVPVKVNLTLDFNKHYQQADSIKVIPNFITISGAAEEIAKINRVETVSMSLKDVSDSLALDMDILKTGKLKLIDLSQPKVKVLVDATKFTEGSIELPVEVANLPHNYSLKIFPDKVTVKYNVAFKNYEKISQIQFKALVDYQKIEQGSTKLKVQLVKFPAEIRSVKLSPEKVEYIIRK
ncbi:MAG: CdaR family protein [Bacteroidia bacterium]